ncbi:hypothetical protein LP421_07245 [Rhizobium sp. RCAM05350]|nr:hypothetical protein LP421_07245 [Rhizobium sp. RCAM05350]
MPGPLDLQSIVDDIHHELSPRLGEGKVADYIPQLAPRRSQAFRHGDRHRRR